MLHRFLPLCVCLQAAQSCTASECVNGGDEMLDDVGLLQLRDSNSKASMKAMQETTAMSYPFPLNYTEENFKAALAQFSKSSEPNIPVKASKGGGWFDWLWDTCVYKTFEAKDAKDNMVIGTSENMDPALKKLGIDLTGLWWMRGNPVAEVLASFAGSKVNSSTFPAQIQIPNSLTDHWAWNSGLQGSALMKFYSLFDPFATMLIDMENSTFGSIDTALKQNPVVLVEYWGFDYMNEDEWNRTTLFQDSSPVGYLFGHNWYTLTRILKEDGSPTKFWDEFLKSADGTGYLQTFQTNSSCLRECRIAMPSCTVCEWSCKAKSIFR